MCLAYSVTSRTMTLISGCQRLTKSSVADTHVGFVRNHCRFDQGLPSVPGAVILPDVDVVEDRASLRYQQVASEFQFRWSGLSTGLIHVAELFEKFTETGFPNRKKNIYYTSNLVRIPKYGIVILTSVILLA